MLSLVFLAAVALAEPETPPLHYKPVPEPLICFDGPCGPRPKSSPAAVMEQTITLQCVGTTLRVANYGLGTGTITPLTITVDDKPLVGDKVAQLNRDLSNYDMNFQLHGLCASDDTRQIDLVIVGYQASDPPGGPMTRYSGRATIKGGRLTAYTFAPGPAP